MPNNPIRQADFGLHTYRIRCTIYDARGNGGGIIAPTITGNHQDRITDYTAIVVEVNDSDTEAVF